MNMLNTGTRGRNLYVPVLSIFSLIFFATTTYAQSWTQEADFGGGGRQYSAYFAVNGKGYIGFGNNNQVNDLWEYDPTTNVWTQKAPIPENGGRAEMVAFVIGNKAYVGLGLGPGGTSNELWEYDPAIDTWTAKSPFPGAWTRGPSVFSIGTKGYIASGSVYTQMYEYDATTDMWTQKADIPVAAERYYGVGFGIGNKGYMGTGVVGSTPQNDFWEYDPTTDTWTQKADLGGLARVNSVSFSNSSRGYIATGFNNAGIAFSDVWEYDPGTNTWAQKANYGGGGRFAGAGFAIGCKCYLGVGTDGAFNMHQDLWSLSVSSGASLTVSADTTICPGSSVILTASGGSTYSWTPSTALNTTTGPTVTASPTSTTSYTVSSNTGGCTAQATVVVTVGTGAAAGVSISSDHPDSVCSGTGIVFTALPVNGGTPFYQWKVNGLNAGTNSPVFNFTANDSSVITCLMTSSSPCATGSPAISNAIIIHITSAPVAGNISANPDTACSGASSQLAVTGSLGSIQWQSSLDGNSFMDITGDTIADPLASGILQTTYYRVKTNGTCGADTSAIFTLLVNPLPTPTVSATDSLICSSDSARVNSAGQYVSYLWNNGDERSYTYVNAAGGYWVSVTDVHGCTGISTHQNISVYPVPSVSIVVQGDTLASFNSNFYQWYFNDSIIPGANSPVYVAQQTGDYAVQIVDSNNCRTISNNTYVLINGITDLTKNDQLVIYPNPASTQAFISIPGGQYSSSIRVLDEVGQEIKVPVVQSRNDMIQLDISQLPSALYEIMVFYNGTWISVKLLKQ